MRGKVSIIRLRDGSIEPSRFKLDLKELSGKKSTSACLLILGIKNDAHGPHCHMFEFGMMTRNPIQSKPLKKGKLVQFCVGHNRVADRVTGKFGDVLCYGGGGGATAVLAEQEDSLLLLLRRTSF